MNEITIGDKVYISAKRAAEITGYARDYVGQLCREGHVDAKMVGRSWYVFEPSIRAHRFGIESVPEGTAATEHLQNEAGDPESASTQTAATASDWQAPTYEAEAPTSLPELTPSQLEELLPPAEETLTDMQAAWREWFDQKQKVLETPEIESPEVIDARNEAQEAVYSPQEEIEEDKQEVQIPLQKIEEPVEEDEEDEEEEEEDSADTEDDEQIIPIQQIRPRPVANYEPVSAPRMDIHRDIPVSTPAMPMYAPATRYTPEYAASEASQGRVIQERIIPKKGQSKRRVRHAPRKTHAPAIAVLIGISLVSITIALIGTGYAGRYLRTLPAANSPVINFLVGTQKFIR